MGFVSERIGRRRSWIRGALALATCCVATGAVMACTSTLDFDKTKTGGDGGTTTPPPDAGKADTGGGGQVGHNVPRRHVIAAMRNDRRFDLFIANGREAELAVDRLDRARGPTAQI